MGGDNAAAAFAEAAFPRDAAVLRVAVDLADRVLALTAGPPFVASSRLTMATHCFSACGTPAVAHSIGATAAVFACDHSANAAIIRFSDDSVDIGPVSLTLWLSLNTG